MPPPQQSDSQPSADLPALSRSTFDRHWFTVESGTVATDGGAIHTHRLAEVSGSRTAVLPHISAAVLEHHFHERRVADQLAALGHAKAAAFFASEMPRPDRTRKGNFGEVIASEHLVQRHGYKMPVLKLRYRDHRDMPMRGEDMIAFEVDEDDRITRLIVGEAKTVVQYAVDVVRRAHARLASAFNPRPMTLSMLAAILYDNDATVPFAQEIDRVSNALAAGDFPRSHWIVLINQVQPDNPFDALGTQGNVVANLQCVAVRLENLTGLVNAAFDPTALLSTGR